MLVHVYVLFRLPQWFDQTNVTKTGNQSNNQTYITYLTEFSSKTCIADTEKRNVVMETAAMVTMAR